MKHAMKIGIAGGGVMGEAILAAALDAGVFDAASATVAEPIAERRDYLHAAYGVRPTADVAEALGDADVALVAVKPQDARSVRTQLRPEALLVSVMAGVKLDTLAAIFGHRAIVRVMPNTPAAVREGMSVWTATPEVSDDQQSFARNLLASCGREVYVANEAKLDMATALSGSGPGYVFLFIEAMIEGGVEIGLTRAEAEELAVQTVLGAAAYARASDLSAADLRARVTSPGGTTAAGLLELERAAVRAAIIEAIRAAHERSVALGRDQ